MSASSSGLFAVFDNKAETYSPPFVAASDAAAARLFGTEVNRHSDDNLLNRYPADFSLHRVADWDNTDVGSPVSFNEGTSLIVNAPTVLLPALAPEPPPVK
ncbi:MAG: nonstructural protein [Microvirus sp.]|nr:MAG: nonstructural protein [Microvirus sp.]